MSGARALAVAWAVLALVLLPALPALLPVSATVIATVIVAATAALWMLMPRMRGEGDPPARTCARRPRR